jgi:DNA-binding MarR family transcriptional regulator
MAAMKENTRKIFDYLKEHDGETVIAQDIANALGLNTKQVNGSVNSFVKKELAERSAEKKKFEFEDGTTVEAKTISLTDKGRSFDPDAPEAE